MIISPDSLTHSQSISFTRLVYTEKEKNQQKTQKLKEQKKLETKQTGPAEQNRPTCNPAVHRVVALRVEGDVDRVRISSHRRGPVAGDR